MSSAIFGKLAKDVKIKIKRSNGVVHAATITSLVEENHTVNVEVRICAWNQVSVNLSGTARWYDFKTFSQTDDFRWATVESTHLAQLVHSIARWKAK